MPLESSRACPTLVSKRMVPPGLLIVSLTLCLSSVSGGAVTGRGGWSYGSRGGGAGGVHSRRSTDSKPLLHADKLMKGSDGGLGILHGRRDLRGGGKKGAPPARKAEPVGGDSDGGARPGTMESEQLLAGNVQRLQFLRARAGIDLGASVFCLYSMAIRNVVATVGQPLRAAIDRKDHLLAAAAAERAASALGIGVGVGLMGPAAEAAARDAAEPMPFPYMPSVGALLLALVAVVAHALLLLGKRWSVRFHAWSSFEEVLTWEEADAVLVTPVRHSGTPAICPLSGTPRAILLEAAADGMPDGWEEEEEEDEGEGMAEDEEERGGEGEEEEEETEEEGVEESHEGNAISEPRNVSGVAENSASLSEDFSSSDEHVSSFEEQSSQDEEEGGSERERELNPNPKEEEEGELETEEDFSSGTDGQPDLASAEGAVEGPSFVYQRRKFVLKPAAAADSDDRHSSEEEGVEETFGLVELPVGWPLRRYLEAKGLTPGGISESLRLFGENSVDVKPPTFWHHLGERLTSPFVVFSLFNQVLWMLELYWLKAVVAIFEVVAFEAAFVADAERRRRELDIRNAKGPKKRIRAWRAGTWVAIPVEEMLPGDLVSVRAGAATRAPNTDTEVDEADKKEEEEIEEEMAFAVGELPADVLLLRGTAVVNEASLTGESVPQIKTSLTSEPIDFDDHLDMSGTHSGHVLLSGTTLLDQTDGSLGEPQQPTGSSSTATGVSSLPDSTPDGGALCYVLRTGAYSFQGDLRRMIDFGSHGIREESKDAAYLLLFLLSFAALSSFHVVREGLKSKQVSGFRLLVQCVRILSAVVPNDLSFELNQCLRNGVLSLQKGHALACTEPFRIPLAGNVDVCLFDKTGTITSDRLIAETLVTPQSRHLNDPPVTVKLGRSARSGGSGAASGSAGETLGEASMELAAKVVVGGCHSLMNLDGVLHGDPLEASALEGIGWHWNATSHIARPQHPGEGLCGSPVLKSVSDKGVDTKPAPPSGSSNNHPKARGDKAAVTSGAAGNVTESCETESSMEGPIDEDNEVAEGANEVAEGANEVAGGAKDVAGGPNEVAEGDNEVTGGANEVAGGANEVTKGAENAEDVAVAVWRRYAFSSQLQRMSVVAEVSAVGLTADAGVPEAWVLSKGSPEAILPLLDKGSLPTWYEAEYARLATAGRRVVALAHRSLGASETKDLMS